MPSDPGSGRGAACRAPIAVLFDRDGVIVDSRAHHVAAWQQWAREHAPDAPTHYFTQTFGLRNDAIIIGLLPGLAPDELSPSVA